MDTDGSTKLPRKDVCEVLDEVPPGAEVQITIRSIDFESIV